jgi:hypothetical protein
MKKTGLKLMTAAVALALLTVNVACNSKKENTITESNTHSSSDGHDHEGMSHDESEVNEVQAFANVDNNTKSHINNLINNYLDLKNALTDADQQKAKEAAEKVIAEAGKFDASSLPQDQKTSYETSISQLKTHSEHVVNATNLEGQREALPQLTESVYTLTKSFGANEKDLFFQHCPMAFEGKGANWISEDQKIRNPYFGEKMMTCGENKEKLAKK